MEGDTQSFVVRIWYEATDGEGHAVAWRGFVDHVGSARRLYFHDLGKITSFIQQEAGLDNRQCGPKRGSSSLRRFIRHVRFSLSRLIYPT